jgi:hypothetical protein
MKRASYKHGVEIIALNDEPTCLDVQEVQCFISVTLLADLFDVPVETVARDVVKLRLKEASDKWYKIVKNQTIISLDEDV